MLAELPLTQIGGDEKCNTLLNMQKTKLPDFGKNEDSSEMKENT